jgi:hypothetical protein
MLPEVSVPVIKNRIYDPTRRQFKPVTQTDDERQGRRLGKCESDQAGAKQDNTGNGHSEEAVRSEFITHSTPPNRCAPARSERLSRPTVKRIVSVAKNRI